ncbi:MAG: 4-hydroxy-tetrahydrodipicolinate reductase, partial [Ferruginibacter sp.]
QQRGHTITAIIQLSNKEQLNRAFLQNTEVVIECIGPESAAEHLRFCFENGFAVVCGTTGWLHHWDNLIALCQNHKGRFLYASNFSMGVNLFFELNEYLAKLMSGYEQYIPRIEETHHTAKKDAPSGTAISLADGIIHNNTHVHGWITGPSKEPNKLSIDCFRIDPAPGTHIVRYESAVDSIDITHTAHNRNGFALGAVLAAEFLQKQQPGIYQMKDVLGIRQGFR